MATPPRGSPLATPRTPKGNRFSTPKTPRGNATTPRSSLLTSMLTTIEETKQLVRDIEVEKSNFLTLSFYLRELKTVLTDLATKREMLNSDTHQGLQKLNDAIADVHDLAKASSSRCRVFLLLNSIEVAHEIQDKVQEIGHCLHLMPVLSLMAAALSSEVHDMLPDLRLRMRNSKFEADPLDAQMGEAIGEGLELHLEDSAYATELLAKLARHFQVPVAEAGVLRQELQRDLEEAELEERADDVRQLEALKQLLDRAVLAADQPPLPRLVSQLPLGRRLRSQQAHSVSDKLKCPLTGLVMVHPATLVQTGQTYESSAIKHWLAQGNATCPASGQALRNFEVRPNAALKAVIDEELESFCQHILLVAIRSLEDAAVPPQVAAQQQQAVPLQGGKGGEERGGEGSTEEGRRAEEVDEALDALLQLCRLHVRYGQHVLAIGGIGPLVRVVARSEDGPVRKKALAVLADLAAMDAAAKASVVKVGGLEPLLKVCAENPAASGPAVRVLEEISKTEEGRAAVTDAAGVIALIKLLHAQQGQGPSQGGGGGGGEAGLATERTLENFWRHDPYVAIQMASVGMFKPLVARISPGDDMDTRVMMADGVMTWGVNMAGRVALVQAGVVPPLVDLLNSSDPVAKVAAARAIEHLSHTEVNRVALAKAGVIPGLVKSLATGNGEIREAAKATLANLAMDDQDLDEIDEDGAVVRLVQMLKSSAQSSREYAVRTLESMVRENRALRACVAGEAGAVAAMFSFLQKSANSFTAGSIRGSTLLLISYMCQDPEGRACMLASPEVVRILSQLLEKPTISDEEKEAALVVLATMAGLKEMRGLLCAEPDVVPGLAGYLQAGNARMREAALDALQKLADPADVATQVHIARLGAVPVAIEFLREGPDNMRLLAVLLLGRLSVNTARLVDREGGGRRSSFGGSGGGGGGGVGDGHNGGGGGGGGGGRGGGGGGGGGSSGRKGPKILTAKFMMSTLKMGINLKEGAKQCRVHAGGKCNPETNFCIVQGEVAPILVQLIEQVDQGGLQLAEASLDALSTLLVENDDLDRAAEYLVKLEVVPAVAGLVHRTPALTEKSAWLLKRVFQVTKYRSPKYSQSAIQALGRFMTTATGTSRKAAADALMHLNFFPKDSANTF